jgi:hypothetical protein
MPIFKRLAVFAAAVAAVLGLAASSANAAVPHSAHHQATAYHATHHRHAGWKHHTVRHHHLPTARRDAPRGCPKGELCAYTGANYSGHLAWIAHSHSNLRHAPAFQHVKSLYNNSRSRSITLYARSHYRGHQLTLRHGTGVRHLGPRLRRHIRSANWHYCRYWHYC